MACLSRVSYLHACLDYYAPDNIYFVDIGCSSSRDIKLYGTCGQNISIYSDPFAQTALSEKFCGYGLSPGK